MGYWATHLRQAEAHRLAERGTPPPLYELQLGRKTRRYLSPFQEESEDRMISLTRIRGRRGWTFHLVLRLPVWWRPFRRQQAPVEAKAKEA